MNEPDYKLNAARARNAIEEQLKISGIKTKRSAFIRVIEEGIYYSISVEVARSYYAHRSTERGVKIQYETISSRGSRFNPGFRTKTWIRKEFLPEHIEKIVAEVKEALSKKIERRDRRAKQESEADRLKALAASELPDEKRIFDEIERRSDGTYRLKLALECTLENARRLQRFVEEMKGTK